MYIPFNQLPSHTRVWIYGAPRPFSAAEIAAIEASAPAFINGWATHGHPLQASYQVLEEQFLVIAVDEQAQAASGCSIDSSMGYVRSLEQSFDMSLTDRSLVYFMVDNKVVVYPLAEIKQKVADEVLTPDTPLINTLATSKEALEHKWLIPAAESWLKRYFKKATA